ncbi:MAG: PhoH family protein, partial [Bacteroidetes bacterium]|nr:PhoH family protein [Bacteroidota bacterium]
QMKMFLTRIGPSAKAIITGDMTQVDLPKNQQSGLTKASRILRNVDGIGYLELDEEDVVRHRLVKAIIRAYDAAKEKEEQYQQQNQNHRNRERDRDRDRDKEKEERRDN